ncbi:MAG: hypothetical protein GY736_14870 [Sphingomonas sp.]|uniref:hypothetical protein n=1 Tax=Sphingomonas sp. TaxID=28214 RepID=UPI00258A6CC0|nr:hypothetical protein [Sphingomonas sp.]MCP4027571.1 hypothetical protein [Sphingomonas sp.]
MIALALALAVQGTPLPAEEPDIVVIGRRLAALSVRVGRDPQGRFTCGLSQSTGNARLDEQLCRTAAKCVKTGAIDQVAAAACIDRRKPALLEGVRRSLAAGARP